MHVRPHQVFDLTNGPESVLLRSRVTRLVFVYGFAYAPCCNRGQLQVLHAQYFHLLHVLHQLRAVLSGEEFPLGSLIILTLPLPLIPFLPYI